MNDFLSSPDTWAAFITLTFLEIVLGIDNIIFISIASSKLEPGMQKKASRLGLLLAMIFRVLLLIGVFYLVSISFTLFEINWSWLKADISFQSIILILGGIFLLYKSTSEIHSKVENKGHQEKKTVAKSAKYFNVIFQIVLIDLIFSFDSVLTAVGMTNGIDGALIIMIAAVVISIVLMMLFSTPVNNYVNKHPTIQILALSFLILIGFMLIIEGAHLSKGEVFNQHIGAVPKGYLYFAIAFSFGVELLNLRMKKKKKVS